jgi:hypothetical protein
MQRFAVSAPGYRSAMNRLHRFGLLIAIAAVVLLQPSAGAQAAVLAEAAPTVAVVPFTATAGTPSPEPSGSADGDTNDWSGIPWLLLALLIPVVVVGGVILAKRRSPSDGPRSDPR